VTSPMCGWLLIPANEGIYRLSFPRRRESIIRDRSICSRE
jgi:hypothetical protein